MNKSLANIKNSIRTQMKQRRDALPIADRKKLAVNISNNFMGNIPINPHDVIAFYYPMAGEIDLRLMMDALIEQGHKCVLPVIIEENQPLIFRQYNKGDKLVPYSKFRIMQPSEKARKLTPNIIIVPLLAFDEKGNRIGYGGGFYDRTLKSLSYKSNLLSIGVGYDFMKIAQIPTEKHDLQLDCVVTDKQIVVCE